eukprot:3358993-Pyramimonas_sp.AAC.1
MVNQALKTDLAQSATRTSSVPSSTKALLFEWCCNPSSKLSKKWTSTGGAAVRCGLPEHDLSRPAVVNKL